ncbi:MAG: hypothetical protein ACRDD1_13290, partial [Planctomycetia bacterium]
MTNAGEDEIAPPPLDRLLEAMVFVGGAPATADDLRRMVPATTDDQFHAAADRLADRYRRQGRPYEV